MARTWNLDQALLWVATRDATAVDEAADVKRFSEPKSTWRSECVGLALDDEAAGPLTFIMASEEAENSLLKALVNGQVAARYNLDPIDAEWFDEAEFADGGDPPVMLFRRESRRPTTLETPLGAWFGRCDVEEVRPRFQPAELQRVFAAPLPPSETGKEPAEGQSDDAFEPGKGARSIGVRQAVVAIWGDQASVPVSMSKKDRDNHIIEWIKTAGGTVPDPRTIRRFFNGR